MSVPIITTKIYKSVSLLPGEEFTLPPNATLISSTDTASLTSTCDIADLEELACYAFVFGNAGDEGGDNQLFEASNVDESSVPARGIYSGNKFYPFNELVFPQDDSGIYPISLIDSINTTTLGQVIFSAKIMNDVNSNDHGTMSFITFKALPSMASSLQLSFFTYAPEFNQGNTDNQNLIFNIPARPYSEVEHYNNIPTCD
jgi:hypothetical protein